VLVYGNIILLEWRATFEPVLDHALLMTFIHRSVSLKWTFHMLHFVFCSAHILLKRGSKSDKSCWEIYMSLPCIGDCA